MHYTVNEAGVVLMEIINPPMKSLSRPVLDVMRGTMTKALSDRDVRVKVIMGTREAFLAGADIGELNDCETRPRRS